MLNQGCREIQEPINKVQWKKCCFSFDGENIVAAALQKSNHSIYIWGTKQGNLIKHLEGPKEGIMDLQWHPTRPTIVSVSTSGSIFVWGSRFTENWSAYAPGFKELEENEEYIEKEDEFDIVDDVKDKVKEKEKRMLEESPDVDILTKETKLFGESDSDADDELLFIAITIEPEKDNY